MSRTSGCGGRVVAFLFGTIFFSAGVAMIFGFIVIPMQKISAAKEWTETPCTVIWSRVRSHEGDDSTTYDVEIFYEYEVNGSVHRSNTRSFVSGSSSGLSGKQKVVKEFPARKETVCYVNPEVPEQAVLDRELSSLGLWWLFPIPFALIGFAVMVASLFSKRE